MPQETRTQSLDGQSYTITEKKTSDGDLQTNENFINMNKGEKEIDKINFKDKLKGWIWIQIFLYD